MDNQAKEKFEGLFGSYFFKFVLDYSFLKHREHNFMHSKNYFHYLNLVFSVFFRIKKNL